LEKNLAAFALIGRALNAESALMRLRDEGVIPNSCSSRVS
jgi:hypothetical protein